MLKHATDQGKVAACGPQTGPRGHVSVLTVEQQNRRDPHSHDDCLRGLIEGVGPCAEALDSNFRRWAGPFKPAAHGPTVDFGSSVKAAWSLVRPGSVQSSKASNRSICNAVEVGEIGVGKSAEDEIALLGSPMPASEQDAPASDISMILL